MTSKTRYEVKFGNVNPIPVEKSSYNGATLTKAVDDIRARIDEAIEEVSKITSVRKARNKDFSSNMVSKKQRNLFIKIGYGRNNEKFSDTLIGYFDCPIRAKTALIEARGMLSDGEFDEDILELIKTKRDRALEARASKQRLLTAPVRKITKFIPIAHENGLIAAE